MKNRLAFSVALLLVLVLLTGCSGTGTPGDTTAPGTTAPSTTEPAPVVVPAISAETLAYPVGEEIVVIYYNVDAGCYIAIQPGDADAFSPIDRRDAVGTGEVRFPTEGLAPGPYTISLHTKGDLFLTSCHVMLLDLAETDCGAKAAVFRAEKTDGVSRAFVTVTPAFARELTYEVSWSKGGARLAGYNPIATVTSSGEEPFEIRLNDMLFMPEEADGVEVAVLEGTSTPVYAAADDTLKAPASELLIKFPVLSDLHIATTQDVYVSHFRSALADIREIAPDAAVVFTVGDNTDVGKARNYELLFRIIKEELTDHGVEIPFRYTIGNHDLDKASSYEKQLELFLKQTGMPGLYYACEYGGMKFIVLGSEEKEQGGVMYDGQIDWLEEELRAAGTDKPVFLFMHEPLIETVAGSLYSLDPGAQYSYGFTAANERLRAILAGYPNVIFFTGHTHFVFESYQPVLYGAGRDASFVGCPATGYLWNDDTADVPGAEGWYVEVYKDYVLLKGREFTEQKWCAAAQFLFPIG